MCEILTLLHELPKKHGLSIEWIADHIGVNPYTLQRQLNKNEDFPFSLKTLIPLMTACNNDYSLLDLIESRLGRVAVSAYGTKEPVTMETAAKIAEQQGKALSCLITALADNKLDEDEKRDLRDKYCALAQLIHTALQALNK